MILLTKTYRSVHHPTINICAPLPSLSTTMVFDDLIPKSVYIVCDLNNIITIVTYTNIL